ncbi:hypothetical protein ET475_16200 [Microbacterium protaetiae]|uniref:DUF4386 family protein n=1 Tax=Microbacterium protaetiae TaxID=2509458 RepID=A0A4P6EGC3_9MICO|nr:hypothetical protein [Microbacterium protaetiae]QAY61364.1 hypothetical protein ET475_16200 [Microbacterium protaetiae]
MTTTTTLATRWRLILTGLILGPALLVTSNAFIIPEPPGGMRAAFDAMAAQPWMLLLESIVEGLGFAISLAAFAAVTWVVRARGGAVATIGAIFCLLGVLGFAWSAGGGIFLSVLAGMPDQDAGFAAAQAMNADPLSGALIMALMFVAEAGICLVVIGLLRARLISFWPLVLVVAGIVADMVLPGVWSGLAADVLLLAAAVWLVVRLPKARAYFLSLPSTSPESAAMNAS